MKQFENGHILFFIMVKWRTWVDWLILFYYYYYLYFFVGS